MEKIIDVAQYVFDEYKRISHSTLDEMKLHKLLYFIQRESIAITGEPMFSESLEGWKHGPVSRLVRSCYTEDGLNTVVGEISEGSAYIVRNVVEQYGVYSSWALRDLSHAEISWLNSRKGLAPGQIGNVELDINDIREDAKKVRPYDSLYDMYYDEFDEVAS